MRIKRILLLLAITLRVYSQEPSNIAIVNSGGLRLRSEPNTNSEIIEKFERGTKLLINNVDAVPEIINNHKGSWVNVSTINGYTGWTYDQWLDIFIKDDYYIAESNFTTSNNVTISPKKIIQYNGYSYQIGFAINSKGDSSILLNKYHDNVLINTDLIEIDNLQNTNIYSSYDFEKYLDFLVLDDDDLIIACRIKEDLCVFRIKNKEITWSKTYETETWSFQPNICLYNENSFILINENSKNMSTRNFDISIRKIDILGNLQIEKCLSTEEWDNIQSVNCIDGSIFILGDFNGLKNPHIYKLDNNLNILGSKRIDTDRDASIVNVNNDGKNLYFTMKISGTRGNIGRPIILISLNTELEINWSKSILGDMYNVNTGLRYHENYISILNSTKKDYLYGRDSDDKRFSLFRFSTDGNLISEEHFLLPISSLISDYILNDNSLMIFGKMIQYKDIENTNSENEMGFSNGNMISTLSKIYFSGLFNITSLDNYNLDSKIESEEFKLKSTIHSTNLYEDNSSSHDINIYINHVETFSYINNYPWDDSIIAKSFYFEESQR